MGIVRHHDDGLAELLVQARQDGEHFLRRGRIQIPRRLVGQNQSGIGDNRSGDRDALLLAAGKLPRIVVHPVAQADQLQRRGRVLHPLLLLQMRQRQGQLHVLHRRQHRNQIEGLENESDILVAPVRDLAVAELAQIVPEHADLAAGRGIHRRDQVQQSGFTGAGRPHERHELALLDIDIHFFERDHVELVADEFLREPARADYSFTHD